MEIHTTRKEDVVVSSLRGRLDAVTATEFEKCLSDLILKGERRFQVDLSGLDYISSAGLRAVLISVKKVKEGRGEIVFSGLKGPVKETFHSSGFYAILEVIEPRQAIGRARPLSDREYAECFHVFKSVSTEWNVIIDWIEKDFLPSLAVEKPVNILSIGSGTGDFDLIFMKALRTKARDVSYVALDPNEEHNAIFLRKFEESSMDIRSFRIVPKPFRRGDVEGPFDIIHLTHCLYYIQDRKEAIRETYELLKPGGSLLIFHQTPLGINEIQNEFMRRVKGSEKEMFSSRDILKLFDELGIRFKFDILVSDLDVTDCVENNKRGNLLLNFFLESNLESFDNSLREEIVSMIKETSRCENGRYYLFHPGGIFWVKKDG
jgi:anti-anti-sigma factor